VSPIKRSFGAPAQSHQLQRRIECAWICFADLTQSLLEILLKCGFRFQGNFSTAVRKIAGTTHSGYRNSVGEHNSFLHLFVKWA
jgi:AraC-like DNA-binding protein